MSFAGRSASVEFRSVSRQYGRVVAVNDVSFTIRSGTLATLLGPSGCGKTTTLRMIAGLEVPSAGRILIGGEDVTTLPPMQRDVSMVFQSYALFPHMTVLENVAYGLAGSGETRPQQEERARQGLALVGLSGFERRMPSELSGGQQQRVAVARALVLEPRVLLFDEPLSNLDAKLRRRMREEIRDLQQGLGLTSVYVTHDQEEALAVSDTIIVMDQACIAQIGTPWELYRRPASAFVADFIGGANLLPCEVTQIADGVATVQVGPVRVQVEASENAMPGTAKLVVRPGAVAFMTGVEALSGLSALPAEIRKATYLGSHWEYTLATDLGEVFVTQSSEAGYPPGTSVLLALERRGLALVSV
ncbi:ABC transporter ATP-binding protein [Arenibaculum pallidiluteum]|uniref:ABC transporter ATP-binding protein n=1 Tax=Arenibaculum pallidiluteum TaxID=2812559 RepID=UPI001A969326|nr:ABC transporter ATP-binding protein [Arenibaculum pallidiluteum]